MSILSFDFGGTSIKYGVWDKDHLQAQGAFPTPSTWEELKNRILSVKKELSTHFNFSGMAVSAPGSVDVGRGVIGGISAIEYIHHFDIVKQLSELTDLPVGIDNDANCAALAESWLGSGKDEANILFLVVGTGIGGAVVIDGKIQRGHNLFAGEFGCMILDGKTSFSLLGTAVHMAERYCQRVGGTFSGEQVFELASEGDVVAQEEVAAFYDYLSLGIYNLQFTLDPSCIVIGGAVSQYEPMYGQLMHRINTRLTQAGLGDVEITLRPAQFHNDANLIGAVAAYYAQHE